MIMKIMINLSQILIIKRVSVPNLKSFQSTNTELQAKEAGECSIMLYGKILAASSRNAPEEFLYIGEEENPPVTLVRVE